jgi:hypothetical protein
MEEQRLPTKSEFENILKRLFYKNREFLQEEYDNLSKPIHTLTDWLSVADPDGIGILLSNESDLYNNYWKFLPENVSVYDLMDLYLTGQLPNTPAPKYEHNPIPIEPTQVDQKYPWQSKPINVDPQYFKQMYLIARQRVTSRNRSEVHRARKEVYLAFNRDKGLAEAVGMSPRELNDWIRQHSGLTVEKRGIEDRLNHGKPEEHQWI